MSDSMDNANRRLEYLHAQQASAWVQAMLDPTAEQRAAFVKWLKESPRNVRDFLFMLTIEQALDHLDPKCLRDIDTLLSQVDDRVVPLAGAPLPPPAQAVAQVAAPLEPRGANAIRRRRAWIAAAGLTAASILVWTLAARESFGWKEFATATGEQRAFELEDGSVIHLNTHSRIALRFAGTSREVRLLQGEALFRVHHDAARPFRVFTSDAVIQAVGTQFDVYNRPDGTLVAVIEGRVNVTPEVNPSLAKFNVPVQGAREAAATRSVGASEKARIDRGGVLSVRAAPDVSDAVAWRERRLVFRQETLEYIVAEFNRYSARQIHLEGTLVAGRTFSGVFDADDPDSLAQVLARDSSLSVSYSDRGIVVNAR
jgi:transmembrane sensor